MRGLASTVLFEVATAARTQDGATGVREHTDPAQAAMGPIRDKTAQGCGLLFGGMTLEDRFTMHTER